MNMSTNICKASAYHIRFLRHIRRFIDEDAATSVATALVSARIDYCNSLLYGTSKSKIDKRQRLQNSLARSVMCTAKFDSIIPVLAALHWLPISARITYYQVALLTRKVLTTQRQGYMSSLIRENQPTRQLRVYFGVYFESHLIMTAHVARVARTCYVISER